MNCVVQMCLGASYNDFSFIQLKKQEIMLHLLISETLQQNIDLSDFFPAITCPVSTLQTKKTLRCEIVLVTFL